jgi:hypothetical protein
MPLIAEWASLAVVFWERTAAQVLANAVLAFGFQAHREISAAN